MGDPEPFYCSVDWSHWALPLAVTLSFRFQQFNIAIGPVFLSWCWTKRDTEGNRA